MQKVDSSIFKERKGSVKGFMSDLFTIIDEPNEVFFLAENEEIKTSLGDVYLVKDVKNFYSDRVERWRRVYFKDDGYLKGPLVLSKSKISSEDCKTSPFIKNDDVMQFGVLVGSFVFIFLFSVIMQASWVLQLLSGFGLFFLGYQCSEKVKMYFSKGEEAKQRMLLNLSHRSSELEIVNLPRFAEKFLSREEDKNKR